MQCCRLIANKPIVPLHALSEQWVTMVLFVLISGPLGWAALLFLCIAAALLLVVNHKLISITRWVGIWVHGWVSGWTDWEAHAQTLLVQLDRTLPTQQPSRSVQLHHDCSRPACYCNASGAMHTPTRTQPALAPGNAGTCAAAVEPTT